MVSAFQAAPVSAQDLPPHAIARLGDHRFFHGAWIELVAMSPDGLRIASLAHKPSSWPHITDKERKAFERTIVVWDAQSGQRLRELQAPETPVSHLIFSPDGKQLLAVCGRAESKSHVVFFDVVTGTIARQFGGWTEDFWSTRQPQFYPGGKRLLICLGWDTVLSLDVATMAVHRQWKAPPTKSEWVKEKEIVTRAMPSPDGKYIAWLVDVLPDYSKVPPNVHPPPWVPDPSILVISDTATDRVLYRKDFGVRLLESLTFSADGRRFMVCGKKQVTTWETATGKELYSLADPSAYGLALSPDGRWVLISDGGWQSWLWNLETRKRIHALGGAIGHNVLAPRTQLFSGDGKSVVTWTGSTVRLFDTDTGKERLQPGHHGGRIMVRFSENGNKLFAACAEARSTWELAPGKAPNMLTFAPRQAWDQAGSRHIDQCNDSRLFVDEEGKRVRIRDTATGKLVHVLEKNDWWGRFARFSPDANRLALRQYLMERGIDKDGNYWIRGSNEPERLRLYDTRTGKKTGEIQLKNGFTWVVPVFSPDGATVAWVDRANNVHLHDAASGESIRTLQSTDALPRSECNDADVQFSPDGRRVIVTTYQHELFAKPKDKDKWNTLPTRVFDVASGKETSRFYANPESTRSAARFSCAACSPDGRLLAVAEEGSITIRVIDTDSGKVRALFNGHQDGVHTLAFSPDGKTLASGGEDNVIYLWDVSGSSAN
jgi:WD40 repeat protein